jgi:hypothetical protein
VKPTGETNWNSRENRFLSETAPLRRFRPEPWRRGAIGARWKILHFSGAGGARVPQRRYRAPPGLARPLHTASDRQREEES